MSCVLSCFSCVTLWTIAYQAPLNTGFSRQEYWSGLPWPPPGDLPDRGIEPRSLMSPALAGRFFATSATREPKGYLFFLLALLYYSRNCKSLRGQKRDLLYVEFHKINITSKYNKISFLLLLIGHGSRKTLLFIHKLHTDTGSSVSYLCILLLRCLLVCCNITWAS